MRNLLIICLSIIFFSCQNDDLSWKDEIVNIKNQLSIQQQLIETIQKGITIKSVVPENEGYSISFSDGSSISLKNGKTALISIGEGGFWYIDGVSTNVNSRGNDGENAVSPTIVIGINGNWIIDNLDTGIKANGTNGTNGIDAPKVISIVQNSTSFVFYFDDGSKVTVSNNKKRISCWGDSITWGAAPEDGNYWTMLLEKLFGDSFSVINCGVGGEGALNITMRQGSMPMYNSVEFTLPSDNSLVPVGRNDGWFYDGFFKSSYNDKYCSFLIQGEGRNYNTINPCYIDGIECTLSYVSEYTNPVTGQYYIKRNTNGDSRVIKVGTPVFTNAAKNLKQDAIIIFMGTNGGWSSVDELIDMHKKMIQFANVGNNYVVFGIYGGNSVRDYSIPDFELLEKKFFKEFGLHYINIRKYATINALHDSGITPTAADIEAIKLGKCPPSLIPDGIHPNSAFSRLIAKLVYDTLIDLGITE